MFSSAFTYKGRHRISWPRKLQAPLLELRCCSMLIRGLFVSGFSGVIECKHRP